MMNHIFKSAAAIALFITGMVSAGVSAHGIWFAERSSRLALIYGVGADDLDTVKRFDKVKTVKAFDENWGEIGARLRIDGPMVILETEGAPHVVSAVLQNGKWSKLPDGKWAVGGRDVNPEAVLSEKTVKYAVHFPGPLPANVQPIVEQELQIMPVGSEMPTHFGDELTVQVLYKGTPVADVPVIADLVTDPDQKPVLTDSEGNATIIVRNQGLNVVTATYSAPTDEPGIVDKVEGLATLSFVLEHLPE